MKPSPFSKSSGAPGPGGSILRAVRISGESVVALSPLGDGRLPLVAEPTVDGLDLAAWVAANRALVDEKLVEHGAVLFRGFDVATAAQFESIVRAASNEMMEYLDRSSPRHEVGSNVYTSTDYPPDQIIFPHNEQSYSITFPQKLFFFCMTPAAEGGETPLVDCRKVAERLRSETRERFLEKQWMYVRNFGDGFGLSWQTAFQTSDPSAVEAHCAANGIEVEWKDGNRLRTRQVRPVVVRHPRTGESIWFNHATFFHVTTLAPAVRDALLSTFADEALPNNTYYGDGTPIEPDVLDELRAAYMTARVSFTWRKGDVVLLDNVLTAHSRTPYSGARRILFAMTEPHTRDDV